MEGTVDDPFDLVRFVDAQRGYFDDALAELSTGRKRSHWIWFVFPQVAGLGRSSMSERYAIRSRAEAEAYLAHPVLGQRLVDCAEALLLHSDKSALEIMGSPDDLKLRSAMTLFAAVAAPDAPFQRVLDMFFDGVSDPKTLSFLNADS